MLFQKIGNCIDNPSQSIFINQSHLDRFLIDGTVMVLEAQEGKGQGRRG